MFHHKKRLWPKILIVFVLLFGAGAVFAYKFVTTLTPEKLINNQLIQDQVIKLVGEENKGLIQALPHVLGYDEPRTYLILFKNNTEIRPGGGFIGTYATVRVDKGKTSILVLEGTERLDARTPADWKPEPPAILKKEIGIIDRWFFRDSNWSPDFEESAKKSLELYKGEGGVAADDIDAVVAFTPTVLEELLGIVGPVTVQGMTFTKENVTETLEYEVEYGFEDKGIDFKDRKQIIRPFFEEVLKRSAGQMFRSPEAFVPFAEKMVIEKQVLIYTTDDVLESALAHHDPFGRIKESEGDYLLWVDANLAALKTDHAMERTLSYEIAPIGENTLTARAIMRYEHNGTFDWRTTRYRTYARVYAPKGSVLQQVRVTQEGKPDQHIPVEQVDKGEELGKQWFGVFVVIEPGHTKDVSFDYILPQRISDSVKNGTYILLVQKQAGIVQTGLTLDLNFGKNITSAVPAEEQKEWGDGVYRFRTQMRMDREFKIGL